MSIIDIEGNRFLTETKTESSITENEVTENDAQIKEKKSNDDEQKSSVT